jgi:hypothetical protein
MSMKWLVELPAIVHVYLPWLPWERRQETEPIQFVSNFPRKPRQVGVVWLHNDTTDIFRQFKWVFRFCFLLMSLVCFVVSCQADKAALQILGDFQPIRPMAALKIILFYFYRFVPQLRVRLHLRFCCAFWALPAWPDATIMALRVKYAFCVFSQGQSVQKCTQNALQNRTRKLIFNVPLKS